MAVCSSDFYSQAESTLANSIGEISSRCCVKNSYYAAFHKVNETLTCEPAKYCGTGVHQSFIEYLTNEAFRHEPSIEKNKLRRLAVMLKQMRNSRAQADYILDDTVSESDANLQLAMSKRLFTLCDEIEAAKVA